VKQEIVQTKYYITIILYQELYVVPVNVECSYQIHFSGFHCGKLIKNRNFKIQTDFGAPLVWHLGTSVPPCP